jgi:epoxide hydrolase-like predicted phosphatase
VPIKAVVFDWGGVLMRTVDYAPRHRWDDRLGLPHGSVEKTVHGLDAWRRAQRGEIRIDDYWRAVGDRLGLTPKQVSQLRVEVYSGDKLDGSVLSSIRQCREKSLKTGLLSNNTSDLLDSIRDAQLETLFDAIVISADIHIMKPEPAAYNTILDTLNVAPSEAVMVDDFPANVDGARAVGMAAVLFTPGGSWNAELQRLIGIS